MGGDGKELIVQLGKLDYQFGRWGVFAGGEVFMGLGSGRGWWRSGWLGGSRRDCST